MAQFLIRRLACLIGCHGWFYSGSGAFVCGTRWHFWTCSTCGRGRVSASEASPLAQVR